MAHRLLYLMLLIAPCFFLRLILDIAIILFLEGYNRFPNQNGLLLRIQLLVVKLICDWFLFASLKVFLIRFFIGLC